MSLEDKLIPDDYKPSSNSSDSSYKKYISQKSINIGNGASRFEDDYERMREKAENSDSFQEVVRVYNKIAKKGNRNAAKKARKVLNECHEIYVENQKRLALSFAKTGDFENLETNLDNASVHGEELDPKISEEEINHIISLGIQNTKPRFFFRKLNKHAEKGEHLRAEEYRSFALKAAEEHNIIRPPKNPFFDTPEEEYIQTLMKVNEKVEQAYVRSSIQKIREALGYSTKEEEFSEEKDIGKINEFRDESKELILASSEQTFRPPSFEETLEITNEVINPVFDEFINCRTDYTHPLRDMYEPKEKENKVIGVKSENQTGSEIVKPSFFERLVETTGMPIRLHSFYTS